MLLADVKQTSTQGINRGVFSHQLVLLFLAAKKNPALFPLPYLAMRPTLLLLNFKLNSVTVKHLFEIFVAFVSHNFAFT